MKDGRTHLNYKAENAVHLDTELIVAAEVYYGDSGDTQTIEDTVNTAQTNLAVASIERETEEVVADRGYHSEDALDRLNNEADVRTYIPEPERRTNRKWQGKAKRKQAAYRRNRRNNNGNRGRKLQRLRSEKVERTFAHLCHTGGARRTWLRGTDKVQERYQTSAMAYNIGRIMRSLTGAGKPRHFAALAERSCLIYSLTIRTINITIANTAFNCDLTTRQKFLRPDRSRTQPIAKLA